MFLHTMRFVALMLAALGMTMGAAHSLELVPKMHYSGQLYKDVTSTLYLFYGSVGGSIQILAILSAVVLSLLLRKRPGSRLAMYGTASLVLSLALWFVLVQPVNGEWRQALRTQPEPIVVESYLKLRGRWEYGHLAAFIAWLSGFTLLVLSALAAIPADGSAHRVGRTRA
jgi:hypothetical protein